MKDFIVRLSKGLLPLLGLGAVAGCENYGPACEYGCPYMQYKVQGRVTDEESNPIPNIRVSRGGFDDVDSPIRTDGQGGFVFEGKDFPDKSITLRFVDDDRMENGGLHTTVEKSVTLTQVGEGDGNWDQGDFEAKGVEVVMPKEKEG